MRLKRAVSIAMSMILAGVSTASAQSAKEPSKSNPVQPKQPRRGPGGSAKISRSTVRIEIPGGAQGGWLFLPSNPVPGKAPVVIFCHGFSAILPRGYQAWIDHLMSRGNIVLWPNYQDNLRVPTREFLPNALAGVKAGLHILQSGADGVRPDLDRVAVVGHSAGGMIAAGIAASAAAEGLPKIKALMPVEPGDESDDRNEPPLPIHQRRREGLTNIIEAAAHRIHPSVTSHERPVEARQPPRPAPSRTRRAPAR